MKRIVSSLVCVAALAACDATMTGGGTDGRVMTEEDFRETVVGRAIVDDQSTLTANADGTISGRVPQGRIVGRWNWQNGYFCRNVQVGGTPIPQDCQTVAVDGSTVTFVRDQGRGESMSYTLG